MSFGDINRVNTNIQALNARFSLNKVNQQLSNNQLKLSTGLRINKAEDDSAGFSIASKLTAQIGGLSQASRNVGDAKSALDVAEAGFNSINDILTTFKSKAVQGATDSVGDDERGFIAKQLNSLIDQIDNVVGQTKFQGKDLLNGAIGGTTNALVFQVGAGTNDSDTQKVSIKGLNATGGITASGTAGGLGLSKITIPTGSAAAALSSADFTSVLSDVDTAISTLAQSFNQLGIDQSSLTIKQDNLQQQINSNSAARSNIQDADFAKLQSESIKLQIQQQTATSAFAQANASSQSVLGFLGQ